MPRLRSLSHTPPRLQDAALYALHPPVVTTLLALEVPSGRRQTVDYGDGSGDQIPGVSLGTTAFVSGELAFAALSPELQGLALQTRVRYAPHPYIWIKQAKARSTGLGIVCDGLEVPLGELPPWTEEAVMTYPAVWRTPGGQPSLQIHGCCVADLVVDGVPMNDLARGVGGARGSGGESWRESWSVRRHVTPSLPLTFRFARCAHPRPRPPPPARRRPGRRWTR